VAWVDRPQGLVTAYRLVAATGWDPMVRILAMAAAAIATVAVGLGAWALAGRRAAVTAAVLFAVVSPAPHLEGFTANGELLATAFTATAIAAAAWWLVRGDRRLLVLAGVAAGIGPLVKQSAVDGLVAVAILVVMEAVRRRQNPSRDLGAFVGGVAIPFTLALAHAMAIGMGDWWFAVAGHRSQTDSLVHGPLSHRLELFGDSLGPFVRSLGPLTVLAAGGVIAARLSRCLPLPLPWRVAPAAGFAVGGLYPPHYWVQLIAPLVLLAAIGLDSLIARAPMLGAGAALVAVFATPLLAAPVYLASSDTEAADLAFRDRRVTAARSIGEYIAVTTDPDARVAVLWANAAVSWYSDRTPAFRYLWLGPLSQIDGAAADARAVVTGADPPEVVVINTELAALDPEGDVALALAQRYRLVRWVGPYPIYRLRSLSSGWRLVGLPAAPAVA
jgi:4-amino-4-deoxy-L-arabinose transferase-like glycosyltransferase